MKILKKISLIIIGILLSLFFLEIGLQTVSYANKLVKNHKINRQIKNKSTITILCLGESTTDGQWPPILQKILDKKSKDKKFNVIDEGVVGTDTKEIAKKLKNNLLKYNPDIVITMMGINDDGLVYQHSKIKILNLVKLIYFHILTHYFYTDASFYEIESECMDLRKQNKFSLVQKKYYNLLKKSKFLDIYAYWRLWELLDFIQEVNISFYDDLLNHDKTFIMVLTLKYILKYLSIYKNYTYQQIRNFLIENKNRILYNCNDQNIIKILKDYDCSFLINDIKNNKESTNNFAITNLLDVKSNSKNYLYIIKEVYYFNSDIFFISMQYPTLPIEDLKNDLKNSPYFDKLIFISNENNFKTALENHKSKEIFTDMFGGSFGHCTEFGNTLIAENVAETILKLYN